MAGFAIGTLGYADEYADQGHFNHPAEDFINAAGNADGYNPIDSYNKVCGTSGRMYKVSGDTWRNVGVNLSRNMEVLSTTNNHAVNVRQITVGYKLNMFGGSIGKRLHLFSAMVHDPLIGNYVKYSHLDCVGIIKY